jgi:hypothetical protein
MSNPEISVIPKSPAEVAKAITYIVLTGASLVVAAQSSNGHVTLAAGLAIAVQVLALIPIYLLAGTAVKTVIAFASAAASTLIQLFVGGYHPLSFADYVAVALAAFAAIGITVVPNKPTVPTDVAAISNGGNV